MRFYIYKNFYTIDNCLLYLLAVLTYNCMDIWSQSNWVPRIHEIHIIKRIWIDLPINIFGWLLWLSIFCTFDDWGWFNVQLELKYFCGLKIIIILFHVDRNKNIKKCFPRLKYFHQCENLFLTIHKTRLVTFNLPVVEVVNYVGQKRMSVKNFPYASEAEYW